MNTLPELLDQLSDEAVIGRLGPDAMRELAFVAKIAQTAEGVGHPLYDQLRLLELTCTGWATMLERDEHKTWRRKWQENPFWKLNHPQKLEVVK